jgi:hypothetical protein
MKNVNWGKVLLASLAFLIIATILRQIETMITMNFYMIPEYFPVWSKLMMPKAGPPPLEFILTSTVLTFITGIVLAGTYDYTKKLFENNFWHRVICFTGHISAIILVFAYLPLFLLINLPLMLIVSWFITTVITVLLGSIVFAKLLK